MWLARDPADMRKSFDGLQVLVSTLGTIPCRGGGTFSKMLRAMSCHRTIYQMKSMFDVEDFVKANLRVSHYLQEAIGYHPDY